MARQRHRSAALSGSHTKAPGSAGGYLLARATSAFMHGASRCLLLGTVLACTEEVVPAPVDVDWAQYNGDPSGTRYSTAQQINRLNVSRLHEVWRVRIRSSASRSEKLKAAAIQEALFTPCPSCRTNSRRLESTPLMWHRTLYTTAVTGEVYALDPVTGRTKWLFDPVVDTSILYPEGLTTRGLSSWSDSLSIGKSYCRRRIFLTTVDSRILALDAERGSLCRDFGSEGTVQFSQAPTQTSPPQYSITSPPIIVGDLVIVGATASKTVSRPAPGVVKAFDARTGKHVCHFPRA